tara:strand:+ start:1336 stop:2265 length:930 start_codon:yes stop_codon:yes gene_type:complete
MVNDLSATRLDAPGLLPRVEVLLENIASGVAFVTIRRTASGRTFLVRGAVLQPVTDAISVVDFECPFNRQIQYVAELFDASGISLGFTSPAIMGDIESGGLLPGEDEFPGEDVFPELGVIGTGVISTDTWMHNPLNPDGGVRVQLMDTAARALSRPVPGGVVYPRGRRVGVMVAEPRRGVQGIVLDVFCEDLETADQIQAFLGDYSTTTVPVICVRLGLEDGRMRVPQPLFLGTNDIVEEDVNVRWGGVNTIQRITGSEVAPPAPGLFVPLLTYADLNAFYETYTAFNAAYASYLAASRDYSLAGFADI